MSKRTLYTVRLLELCQGEPFTLPPLPKTKTTPRGQRKRFAAAHHRRLARSQAVQDAARHARRYLANSPSLKGLAND
jgi:hypothetical protein